MTDEDMTDDDIREMTDRIYTLAAAGRWEEVAALMTPDFVIREADDLPYTKRLEGPNALRDLYIEVTGLWEEPAFERHALTVGDGHAVAILTMTATSRKTGERLRMPICETFRFEGGKCAEIRPYYFGAEAVRDSVG